MIRNSKALSPIFASLIILTIVTVLFIPVFIWAAGMTSQTQIDWGTSGQAASERIVIEEVGLKAGQKSCTIYVRNIGKTAVEINDIIISKASTSNILQTCNKGQFSTIPTYVTQGNLLTLTIPDLNFNPLQNTAYSIQVFTTRGAGDTFQVVTK